MRRKDMGYNLVKTKAGKILLDLTQDNVTPEDVRAGVTFHGNDGEQYTGKALIGQNKFTQLVTKTIAEVTGEDLKGASRIEAYLFFACKNLTKVFIPKGVTTIGDYAFSCCSSLTSITIPDSVTNIGGSAFSGCSSLTSITIPDSVTTIGIGAFNNCTRLTSITIMATTPPTLDYMVFNNVPADCVIRVPADSVEAYKAADGWSSLSDRIFAIEE
jgi:hypothetical protein